MLCPSFSAEVGFHVGGVVSPSFSMPLLRKSNMLLKLGTRVCDFHVFLFCDGGCGPHHLLRKVLFFFGKFEPHEYVVSRSDGGTRAVGNDSGHEPLYTKPEKAVDVLGQGGCSWRTPHFCAKTDVPIAPSKRRVANTSCINLLVVPILDRVPSHVGQLFAENQTMLDVVICRCLDTEHLSKSLDSEVVHRE